MGGNTVRDFEEREEAPPLLEKDVDVSEWYLISLNVSFTQVK